MRETMISRESSSAVTCDSDSLRALVDATDSIRRQIAKRVIGQEKVIDLLLTALLARGHGLFIGVPGLAKTLLISTLAESLRLKFRRIQFTPDLMPADITGTTILEEDSKTGRRIYRFVRGPLFCNLLLADEINRTPPKTQAALLQAMQEYEVTAGGETHPLEQPFLVFATQNPIEQEGTYPLPEAQLDRFMLNIQVDYPPEEDEVALVGRGTQLHPLEVEPILEPSEINRFQDLVRCGLVPEAVIRFAVDIARLSRPTNPEAPAVVKNYLIWGAGPRATLHLVLAAKAYAMLHGEPNASRADVEALAYPVLGHRLLANFQADADGVQRSDIVARIIELARERSRHTVRRLA